MKKLFIAMALMLSTGTIMAQTAEDKAAAKAAAAAQKAAQKEAQSKVDAAIKLNTEINTLYQANLAEKAKGEKCNNQLVAQNEAKIKSNADQGIDLMNEALASGNVNPKKLYDAYRALDDMATQLMNPELQLAAQKQAFDLAAYEKSVYAISEACHGELKYGNRKDEVQKQWLALVDAKFPKCMNFYAYLCMFELEAKNIDACCKALDAYKSFPERYPEIADAPEVKNPEYPVAQFAFNLYYTGYQEKNLALMEKYYDEALKFEDESSHTFVLQSRAQFLKDSGKTDEWVAYLKELIAQDPNSESSEVSMQQMMAYYNNNSKEEMNKYVDWLVSTYPENKIANYCKGYAVYSGGNFEAAVPFFQKAVEIDPLYSDAIYNCGFCLYQTGLEKGREIAGKTYKTQALADKASNEVKEYLRKAAPYFETLKEMEPENVDKWAGPLRTIYTNLGQKAKADALPQD